MKTRYGEEKNVMEHHSTTSGRPAPTTATNTGGTGEFQTAHGRRHPREGIEHCSRFPVMLKIEEKNCYCFFFNFYHIKIWPKKFQEECGSYSKNRITGTGKNNGRRTNCADLIKLVWYRLLYGPTNTKKGYVGLHYPPPSGHH